MKYALAFAIFCVALCAWAWTLKGWGWLLLWPALSFAVAGIAYAGGGPAIFGKRADGSLPWRTWLLLGPFIGLNTIVWRVQQSLSREHASDEVAPGLYVGRRPLRGDLPAGVERVVDLTAEFPRPPALAAAARTIEYVSLPILDATAPSEAALRQLLARLDDGRPTLIHCAQGHGRSGTVACGLVLRRGLAGDAAAAERLVRDGRPTVRLSARQRAIVERGCLG